MNPISGPFYENTALGPYTDRFRARFRQAKPYNLPLGFRCTVAFGYDRSELSSPYGSSDTWSKNNGLSSIYDYYPSKKADVYNRAYDAFKAKVSDSAGWAENLAQAQKARVMFNNRAMQLWRAASALRRGDFGRVGKILGTPTPSKVSAKKKFSQNFLEYEYGWKPIVSDIQSSMKILTSDPGLRKVKGGARDRLSSFEAENLGSPGLGSYTTVDQSYDYQVTIRAGVVVTNHNLFLANQLGLIDLALPWKLLPFSFVVDWFVNVEQVISSMTDWYGLTLINPHVTYFERGRYLRKSHSWQLMYDGYYGVWYTFDNHATRNQTYVDCHRVLGLPGPSLVVRPFQGFSLQRGAQAISLILAVLGK